MQSRILHPDHAERLLSHRAKLVLTQTLDHALTISSGASAIQLAEELTACRGDCDFDVVRMPANWFYLDGYYVVTCRLSRRWGDTERFVPDVLSFIHEDQLD